MNVTILSHPGLRYKVKSTVPWRVKCLPPATFTYFHTWFEYGLFQIIQDLRLNHWEYWIEVFSKQFSYLIEEGVSSHIKDVNFDFSVSDLYPEMFKWKKIPKEVIVSAFTLIFVTYKYLSFINFKSICVWDLKELLSASSYSRSSLQQETATGQIILPPYFNNTEPTWN